jgi:hypothetical protein
MTSESASLDDFWRVESRVAVASGKGITRTQKSYERTQHVIENKGHEFSEPNMSLKNNHLPKVSQHVDDSKRVECISAGRRCEILVGARTAAARQTGEARLYRLPANSGERLYDRGTPLPPKKIFTCPGMLLIIKDRK